MKDVLINICSYNRLEMLQNLIDEFEEFDVIVWDDKSDFTKDDLGTSIYSNHSFNQFNVNFGKKLAWQKFKFIFEACKLKDYKYYFFLPDDCKPCKNFIEKSIELWERIKDNKKICLSWASADRLKEPNWTPHYPVDKGEVILSQWNDLQFMCEKKFFQEVKIKEVDPKRWEQDATLGSGVGSMISNQLCKNFHLYHAKEEMLKHLGNDCSLMNPEERKVTKL